MIELALQVGTAYATAYACGQAALAMINKFSTDEAVEEGAA